MMIDDDSWIIIVVSLDILTLWRWLMLNTRPGKHSQFAIEAMAIEIVSYPY